MSVLSIWLLTIWENWCIAAIKAGAVESVGGSALVDGGFVDLLDFLVDNGMISGVKLEVEVEEVDLSKSEEVEDHVSEECVAFFSGACAVSF